MIATSPVSGRLRCRTTSTTHPTGPASAPPQPRIGVTSIWYSHRLTAAFDGEPCMDKLRLLISLIAVCGWQSAVSAAAKPETPTLSSKGLLYVGAWPHDVLVIDEASEKLVDRIDLKTGVPFTLTLSHDRRTLYAT